MPKPTTGRTTPSKRPKRPTPQEKGKGKSGSGSAPSPASPSTPRARSIVFRDRVVGLVRAAPERLLDHPENWRVHPEAQRDFLAAVLGDIGVAGAALAIIADEKARAQLVKLGADHAARAAWLASYTGPLMLTDGHLRKAMIAQPIPTVVLDLTREEARRALATHDTAGGMAETDVAKLRAIVEGGNFGGTVLERLRAAVRSGGGGGPPPGGPVPESNYREQYAVMVVCEDAAKQQEAYEALTGAGYVCKVVVT